MDITYQIHGWDEYSHWLIMPKQMFISDSMSSIDFPIKQFLTYLPGWPSFLIYPLKITSEKFSVEYFYHVPQLGYVILLSLFYQAIQSSLRQYPKHLLYSISLVLILAVFSMAEKGSLLIELPMHQILLGLLLIFLVDELNPSRPKKDLHLFIMIALASGVLIKKPMTFIIVPGLVYYALSFRSNYSLSLLSKKFFVNTLLILSPFLFVITTWESQIKDYPALWNFSSSNFGGFFATLTHERSLFTIKAMLNKFVLCFKGDLLLFISCTVFVSYIFLVSRENRIGTRTLKALGIGYVVYIISLYWVYTTAFGPFELQHLASFERYVGIVHFPIKGLAFIYFFILLKNGQFNSRKASIIFTLVFFVFFLRFHHQTFKEIAQIESDPIKEEYIYLENYIKKNNFVNPPKAMYILQGLESNGFEFFKIRYHMLQGPPLKNLVELHGHYNFADSKLNHWTQAMSYEKMLELMKEQDIILPIKSDQWFEGLIRKFQDQFKNCVPSEVERFLLIKRKDHFECIEKKGLAG